MNTYNKNIEIIEVAILILLESFLQYIPTSVLEDSYMSQSLFYWNPFCNMNKKVLLQDVEKCRNPYFIGILSAIKKTNFKTIKIKKVAILILLESFLQ